MIPLLVKKVLFHLDNAPVHLFELPLMTCSKNSSSSSVLTRSGSQRLIFVPSHGNLARGRKILLKRISYALDTIFILMNFDKSYFLKSFKKWKEIWKKFDFLRDDYRTLSTHQSKYCHQS